MRSSGMFYSDLFVGAVLIVVVAIAGLAAAVAARTRSDMTARVLAAFAGMTVIATAVMFVVSSPYRGVNPGAWSFGRASMRADELPPFAWRMGSRCLIRDGEASLFSAEVNLREAADQWVGGAFQVIPSASWPQPGISISVVSPPESPVFYTADFGEGAVIVLDTSDGLRGHMTFTATRTPGESASPGREPDQLTGSLEWDCTTPPSP
jgi:hypothetical protein